MKIAAFSQGILARKEQGYNKKYRVEMCQFTGIAMTSLNVSFLTRNSVFVCIMTGKFYIGCPRSSRFSAIEIGDQIECPSSLKPPAILEGFQGKQGVPNN